MNYRKQYKLHAARAGISYIIITYGPRKAVAEVSNHNEPIGRKSGIQLVHIQLFCFELTN